MRSVAGTFLAILSASVVMHAQTGRELATTSATAQATKSSVDLSGVWMSNVNLATFWETTEVPWTAEKLAQYSVNVPPPRRQREGTVPTGSPQAANVPMTPWAEAIYKYNGTPEGAGEGRRNEVDSYSHCSPPAVPRNWTIRRPYEIIQDSRRVLILFEGDHWVRQIWTDGRGHPRNPAPTWGGYSIGKWVGDTLIVETIGFNDKAWVDIAGHPRSEALRLTEHIRRVDHDHLVIDITFEDPKAFTRPWRGTVLAQFRPGWEIGEVIPCEDVILGKPIPKISGMPVMLRPKR